MKHVAVAIMFMCSICATAQQDTSRVYRSTEVDAKPNLKDGMYTLTKFIGNNFVFPPNLAHKQVRIFTSFIVETDGSMSDIKAFYISVKDITPGDQSAVMTDAQKAEEQAKYLSMQAEAARVLHLFKERWIPAQLEGKPVRCLYNHPVNFSLE